MHWNFCVHREYWRWMANQFTMPIPLTQAPAPNNFLSCKKFSSCKKTSPVKGQSYFLYFKADRCLRTFWNTIKNTQAMILKLKMQLTHWGWKHLVEWSRVWLFPFRLLSWNQKIPFFTNFGLNFKPECLKWQVPWKAVNLNSCRTMPIFNAYFQ